MELAIEDVIAKAYETKTINIQEIDKLVKVDDSFVIKAINILENKILNANEYNWFTVVSKKINILHEVENFISEDILNRINIQSEELSKARISPFKI